MASPCSSTSLTNSRNREQQNDRDLACNTALLMHLQKALSHHRWAHQELLLLESEVLRADTLRRFALPDGTLGCTPPDPGALLATLASSTAATLSNAPSNARPAYADPRLLPGGGTHGAKRQFRV